MMDSNTDSIYDFGFTPKKQVATYGKAGRRRTGTTRPATLRHAESAPAVSHSFRESQSRSPERPGLSTRALSSAKAKQQAARNDCPKTRQKAAEEAHSQPLPDPYDFDSQPDEFARPRKKRLARLNSNQGKSTGFYSTPDSSPSGPQSPGPLSDEDTPRTTVDSSAPKTSRRNTPERDTNMEDAAPISMPFSATTSRRLKDLKVSSKPLKMEKHQIPIRLSTQSPSKSVSKKPLGPPTVGTSARIQRSAVQTTRKRRLIDALAAQAEEEASSSQDEAPSPNSESRSPESSTLFRDSPPSPPATSGPSNTIVRPVLATKKTGPKFTYSQQRTMLADDDPLLDDGGLGDLGGGLAGGSLFNFGRLNKSSTINTLSYMDEDDETVNTGAVRSLHELRQAGANSRFADEMDDILERVGSPSAKPSSLRRGALLEVAQKMKHKDFRQQFRNHSDGGSLFNSLAEETDLVSGYAILATAATLLAATTSAHLIQQLRSQGLAALIGRFLDNTTDISQLAKDRKQNVSRNGQATIAAIKSSLLELPVWEPFSLASLSPRTLALKCLDLLMRQSTHVSTEDEVLSQAITDRLFSILADGVSQAACWDFPNQPESCDFHLGLYVLEGHSIFAMQSHLNATWTKQYAETVANAVETALGRPTASLGDLENLTLRLSLNITNQNGEACRMFVDKGLLRLLAKSACSAFGLVMNSMSADSFMSKVLESLIMMLGAMINFCVYYPPASRSLEGRGEDTGSSLDQLIRVFADNHAKTADADSMEKTQLNVALGYLSILLGYLCLNDSIRDTFILVHPKKSTQPLLDSISEFIVFHQKVAEAQGTENGKQGSESGSLARLQSLADQLAALR